MSAASTVADGRLRAFVVISKNANVATGAQGLADAREVVAGVADADRLRRDDVLDRVDRRDRPPVSDGQRARRARSASRRRSRRSRPSRSRARHHDDRHRPEDRRGVGRARPRVVGIAKGVGMIEPDMATLITLFLTDATIERRRRST